MCSALLFWSHIYLEHPCLQEEGEMHAVFGGCGLSPDAQKGLLYLFMLLWELFSSCWLPTYLLLLLGLGLKRVGSLRQKAKGPKVAGWGWVFSGLPVGYKRRRRKRKASEPPLKSECVYRECVLRAEKLTLALAKLHKYPWIKTHLLGETLKTLWKYLLIQSRSLERAACLQGKLPEFVCHP